MLNYFFMKKLLTLISIVLLSLSSFGQTRTTKAAVNFRMTPAMEDNIICRIPKGTVLSMISGIITYRHWVPIRYNGKLGFVYETFLKPKSGKENELVDDYPSVPYSMP